MHVSTKVWYRLKTVYFDNGGYRDKILQYSKELHIFSGLDNPLKTNEPSSQGL